MYIAKTSSPVGGISCVGGHFLNVVGHRVLEQTSKAGFIKIHSVLSITGLIKVYIVPTTLIIKSCATNDKLILTE